MTKENNSNRFSSFFSRIEVEREVLSIINTTPTEARLHGLTGVAIDRWKKEIGSTISCDAAFAEKTAHILHRISTRIGAHSDQSRIVFAGEEGSTLPIHNLIDELRTLYPSQPSK